MNNYSPPTADCWQGRADSLPNERFFQRVALIDIQQQPLPTNTDSIAILGFCSDEGIRRNEGRPGAANGPFALRQQLAKLACHGQTRFIDLGNIVCGDENLEAAQVEFASLIEQCHQSGFKTIALGGGHEIAWGHFSGLASRYANLGIINIDAHFDLRPVNPQIGSTSGTPFWQIADFCRQNQREFHYCCLGIQENANAASLFSLAKQYNVATLTASQINQLSLPEQTAFVEHFMAERDAVYLTICLDAFAAAYAPGVSAPQSLGLTPWQVLPLLKTIWQTGKVKSVDIAELSPAFDEADKTAKLAAMIIAYLFGSTN